MSGVVDFRTLLEDENGNPITAQNPLPTTGGGAGGGVLADVLLTDSNGAIFVSRDDGTTVTYFNLNTNAVYTPVGTISAPSSGGAGGGVLADVLLTDTTGALFVARDNGTTVTYFNLNTNAVYTPVGTKLAVLGLTDTQLRATAVPVAVSGVTGELIEAIEALRMTVGSLSRTIGLSIPDLLGRQRVAIETINGGLTLATVSTLSNQTQIGGFVAADQIPALMHMSADNLRANIKVT